MRVSQGYSWTCHLLILVVILKTHGGFGQEEQQIGSDGGSFIKHAKDCNQRNVGLGLGVAEDCSLDDDLEFVTLENDDDDDPNNGSSSRSGRTRRQAVEDDFEGTIIEDDLSDIYDPLKKVYNTHRIEKGGGYATNDRKHLLRFQVGDEFLHYPPFTYRGFFHKNRWHKIPIQMFLKKRNRSFMLLNHECENEPVRVLEKDCIKKKYSSLPNCSAFDQSPININLTKARDSSLKEFIYDNLEKNKNTIGFDFIMSLPFDGTDILTVELMTKDPNPKPGSAPAPGTAGLPDPPSISKGSIVGKDLYLERIHIKYGINEQNGSEHLMNGSQYGMELQFVFTKNGRNRREQYWDILFNYYTTPAGIDERRKAVHIISILVEVISDDQLKRTNQNDTYYNEKASEAFEILSNAARKFWRINTIPRNPSPNPGPQPAAVPGVPAPHWIPKQPDWSHRAYKTKTSSSVKLKLGDILPPLLARNQKYSTDHSIYYNYKGSMTHPPCFGFVDWAVYDKPLKVSRTMWQNFLYVPSEFDDSKFVAGNYRTPSDVYILGLDKTLKSKDEINKTKIQIRARDLRKSKRSRNSSEPNFKNVEDDYSDDDISLANRFRISKLLLTILAVWIFHSLVNLRYNFLEIIM